MKYIICKVTIACCISILLTKFVISSFTHEEKNNVIAALTAVVSVMVIDEFLQSFQKRDD